MGGEALALVSSSIDNGTLVTLLALRVSERTNENRLSFFFFFFPSPPPPGSRSHSRNTRGFVLGGLIHPRPRMSDRSREKVGIKKFGRARAPRFPFPASPFPRGEESGGFKGSVSSLIHRFELINVFNGGRPFILRNVSMAGIDRASS